MNVTKKINVRFGEHDALLSWRQRNNGIKKMKLNQPENVFSFNCLKNIFVHDKGAMMESTEELIGRSVGLLSLSIGIVSTEVHKIDSYAHLASIASEVKKSAKMKSLATGGSAVIKDRRLQSLKYL